MASELQFDAGPGLTGITAYAIVRNAAGQPYNTAGSAFEAYNAANITDYDHALTEQGASGYFVGNMPAVAAGLYSVSVKQRAGGSPAVSDTRIGGGELDWNGTALTTQLTAAQIATGIWQDATAGDFTVASSIGKALYVSNVAPGGAGGHLISGSNLGTTTFAALTCTGLLTVGDGVDISGSSASRVGLKVAGGSGGRGIDIAGGSGADGARIQSGSGGSSIGLRIEGASYGIYCFSTTSHGAVFQCLGAGPNIYGIYCYSAGGDGMRLQSILDGSNGLALLGAGTGNGLLTTGGASAGGDGIEAVAGGGIPIRGDVTVGASTATVFADALLARNAAGGSNSAKTVAFYLQGGLPKIEQNAAGTAFTIYGADGTTVIGTGTIGRLTTSVGGVEDITPA